MTMRFAPMLLLILTLAACSPGDQTPAPSPASSGTQTETAMAQQPAAEPAAQASPEPAAASTAPETAARTTSPEPTTDPAVGFWVRLTYDEPIDELMWDQLAEAGATDLFVETFYHGFVIYPDSSLFQQRPELEGRNPLRWAIDEAHERGIRLHAWVHALRWGPDFEKNPEIPVSPLAMQASNEDWVVHTIDGARIPTLFVSPAQRAVQDMTARACLDIAVRYPDIDGINLDYIRWPSIGEAPSPAWYDRANLLSFMMAGHQDPREAPDDPEVQAAFRQHTAAQVTGIVETIRITLRHLHPNIMLSAAFFPGRDKEDAEAKAQDWQHWLENDLLSLATPMCYSYGTDGVVEEARMVEEVADPLGIPVWAGLAVKADSQHTPAVQQLDAVRGIGLEGVVFFSHGWIAEQPAEFGQIGQWFKDYQL